MADAFGGIATAFNQGFANGVDAYNARTKRKAILQDQTDSWVQQTEQQVQTMLTTTDKTAQTVQGDDPNWGKATQQMKAQIDDTINALRAHATAAGDQKALKAADALTAQVNVTWPEVSLTTAQRNTQAQLAKEQQGKKIYAKYYGGDATLQGGPTQPPDVGPGQQQAVAPVAPAPSTDPSQIAQSTMPTPNVMSGAQAQPQPAMQLPMPSAAPAAAPAPAAPPAAAPAPAAPMPGQDPARDMAYQNEMDQINPPSEDVKAYRKKAAEDFATNGVKTANDAATGLAGIARAKQLIKEGIIAGGAADWRLWVEKHTGLFGADEIKRTEEFQAIMREQVLKNMRPLGQSTAVSDTDRQFVTQMVGADINLNPGSIAKILDHGQRAFTDVLKDYNKKALRYGADPYPITGMQPQEQNQNTPQADKEGWVDLGNGVKIRAIH
ncbi:MAG TPA: hypothetical protein VIY48_07085 [Candidatus Paceibacterota bacterium]